MNTTATKAPQAAAGPAWLDQTEPDQAPDADRLSDCREMVLRHYYNEGEKSVVIIDHRLKKAGYDLATREAAIKSCDLGGMDYGQPSERADTAPDAYYDNVTGKYWMLNERGVFAPMSDSQMKRHYRALGVSGKTRDGEMISEADQRLLHITQRFDVDFAGALAGYRKGIHEMDGQRILVTTAPVIIEPAEGQSRMLRRIIEGLLGDDPEQIEIFYGWLKITYEALRAEKIIPGQAVVLAGPRNIGKSLLQKIITTITGGRYARPFQFMTGGTQFNAHMFAAEHLMIEDEVPSTEIKVRKQFGAQIKSVTVNEGQQCHAKGRTPISLRPFWRLTISLNDEPEDLQVLPPMDDSLEDKLIMFKCTGFDMPMPTGSPDERAAFWCALVAEIPALLYDLTQWEIPAHLRSERFGVKHYHHPEIMQALTDLSPEGKLLELIDDHILLGVSSWTGSAGELEQELTNPDRPSAYAAKRVLKWSSACGVYLARLQQRYPTRFDHTRTGKSGRKWTIQDENGRFTEIR